MMSLVELALFAATIYSYIASLASDHMRKIAEEHMRQLEEELRYVHADNEQLREELEKAKEQANMTLEDYKSSVLRETKEDMIEMNICGWTLAIVAVTTVVVSIYVTILTTSPLVCGCI